MALWICFNWELGWPSINILNTLPFSWSWVWGAEKEKNPWHAQWNLPPPSKSLLDSCCIARNWLYQPMSLNLNLKDMRLRRKSLNVVCSKFQSPYLIIMATGGEGSGSLNQVLHQINLCPLSSGCIYNYIIMQAYLHLNIHSQDLAVKSFIPTFRGHIWEVVSEAPAVDCEKIFRLW